MIPVNTDLTSVSDASFLGHFIFACKFFMNDEDELAASINNFLRMERKAGSSIQHQLTKIKYITFCKEVEADIESESVHWFRWHKGHEGIVKLVIG